MALPTIRAMTPADLDRAIDWAAAEGWNPGLADAAPFLAEDPGGFLMAWLGDEPASCVSVVRYPGGFAFLGFYICRPDLRGRGLGYAVWQAGMAHAAGCNVGLDGVVAQQNAYRRSGFSLVHRNVRYAGGVSGARRHASVLPIGRIAADRLAAFDRRYFPTGRRKFLAAWTEPPRRGFAVLRDGEIAGYGVARDCRSGSKIGPLFAEDPGTARLLFEALAAASPAGPLFLDLPEPNAEARALAESYGMAPVFETARMYTGADPGLPLGKIYGITTFELG